MGALAMCPSEQGGHEKKNTESSSSAARVFDDTDSLAIPVATRICIDNLWISWQGWVHKLPVTLSVCVVALHIIVSQGYSYLNFMVAKPTPGPNFTVSLLHHSIGNNGLEMVRGQPPAGHAPSGRRLQSSSVCRHDDSYIFEFATLLHEQAGAMHVPQIFLRVNGEFLGDFPLFHPSDTNTTPLPGPVRPGEVVRTVPLFFSERPDLMRIGGTPDAYGFRHIILFHGGEVTMITNSTDDAPPGLNQHWVGFGADIGVRLNDRLFFEIPNATGRTTTTIRMPSYNTPTYTLEVVTSSQANARVPPEIPFPNSFQVQAVFRVPETPGSPIATSRSVDFFPPGVGVYFMQCRAVSIPADVFRPTSVTLTASGRGQVWGYRAVYFVDEEDRAVALLESNNGARIGENQFWIGAAPNSFWPSENRFSIPQITSISTSTTTTRTTTTKTTTTRTTTSTTTTTSTSTTTTVPCPQQWYFRFCELGES